MELKFRTIQNRVSVCLLLLSVILVSGCQSSQQSPTGLAMTPTAVVMNDNTTNNNNSSQSYPAPTGAATAELSGAYPAGQPTQPPAGNAAAYPAAPDGAQVRQNLSQVTAQFISQAPDANDPAMVRLHVKILTSEAVNGSESRTQELVNQETDLITEAASLPALQANDTISAQVSYRGDENGGAYYASQVQKN